uniref:DUF243 domain-containing protein n=1 Tax=Megaselia scalaris TaxID=36166 RepID=T1GL41_MEGSC
MNFFVCVLALLAVASAKPQYDYNPGPISAPQVPFAAASGQYQVSSPDAISAPQYSAPQASGSHFSGSQLSAPHFGGAREVIQSHEAPLVTKQFFLHSAPEERSVFQKTKHIVLGRPQKNYRVVFIKNPSNNNANVHLSAEFAPQEEKTVIYVLSQKDSALDIDNIATPAPTQPSKPEVFFIKYKTPEEARHAQHEIQRQYDVLGGQTQFSDEGTAPVSSVVGSFSTPVGQAVSNLVNEYLPPRRA